MMPATCGPLSTLLPLVVVLVEGYLLGQETKKKLSDSLLLPCAVNALMMLFNTLTNAAQINLLGLPVLQQLADQGTGGSLLAQLVIFSAMSLGFAMLAKDQLKLKLSWEKLAKVFIPGAALWTLGSYYLQFHVCMG